MPRLDRGIQYAAACRSTRERLGALDRPVKPGDDGGVPGESERPKGAWPPSCHVIPRRINSPLTISAASLTIQ
ncbi:hypothetical protein CO669_16365 [Bradyrhizobium sp. Y36]|nr:hypothetical protein CO669_16365 [Bradyrhizobium sp. Y36]